MSRETMTEGTRGDLLNGLEELMQVHPDWRIGQLVANIAFLARQTDSATWDVENEEFVQAARQHLQRTAERREASTQAKQEIGSARQKVVA